MKPAPPHPVAALLYRTVTLPESEAAEAWHRAEPLLDLDDPSPPGAELFGLLSSRLPELGIEYGGLARFHGVRRHNWVSARLALAEVPRDAGSPPILLGRAATVAAYLPEPGAAPISVARRAERFDGHLVEVTSEGAAFRVPAPADHVVWTLERGLWLDAVLTIVHAGAGWESVVEVAVACRRPHRFHQRLSVIDQLGVSVPPWALEATRPSFVEAARSKAKGRLAAMSRRLIADR